MWSSAPRGAGLLQSRLGILETIITKGPSYSKNPHCLCQLLLEFTSQSTEDPISLHKSLAGDFASCELREGLLLDFPNAILEPIRCAVRSTAHLHTYIYYC